MNKQGERQKWGVEMRGTSEVGVVDSCLSGTGRLLEEANWGLGLGFTGNIGGAVSLYRFLSFIFPYEKKLNVITRS